MIRHPVRGRSGRSASVTSSGRWSGRLSGLRPRRSLRRSLSPSVWLAAALRWMSGRRRPGTRVMLAAVLAVVVIAGGGWLFFGSDVFGVRAVVVTGSRIAGADVVRDVAAVRLGTPLARLDTDAVGSRVRTLPSVADATVGRSWPSTVVITVRERVPVAVVPGPAGLRVIDASGIVFDTVAHAPRGMPQIQVDDPGPADAATGAALRVLAALSARLRAEVRVVVATSPQHISLELSGGRRVVWGDAEQNDIKSRVATSLLSRPGDTIDVSAPDVVTVR